MSAVNMWTLLLLAAAVGAGADDCHSLNATLAHKDLDQIFVDWVLVWSVANYQGGQDLLPNVTSSHVELRHNKDENTVSFTERNVYTVAGDSKCRNYYINLTLPAEDSEDQALHKTSGLVEEGGVVSDYKDSGEVHIYEASNITLTLVYKVKEGQFLLHYRKEGHHQDVEDLKKDHDDHQKRAKCLGFPHHKPFIYDGAADFCHKKSSPEPEATAKPES